MDSVKNSLYQPNVLNEQQPDYEKAERDQRIDALNRTYKERVLVANRLYKIQQMLNKAVVTHMPYTLDK